MDGTGTLTNSLPVAATSVDGLVLQTSATATVGAQKYSPALRLKGSGWKTAATAGAQETYFTVVNEPEQGSANTYGRLVFYGSLNGEPAVERMSLRHGFDAYGTEGSGYGELILGSRTGGHSTSLTYAVNGLEFWKLARYGFNFNSDHSLVWSNNNSTWNAGDQAIISRGGTANIRFGAGAANPPVAQTLSVQDASGTDIAPAKWTFRSSRGTGSAINTGILYEWQTPDVRDPGTTLQTATTKMSLTGDGHVFIGGSTTPTGILHLAAGTTAASSAPLKLTAGPLMTAVEEGAMEFKGHTLYFTTYQVRRSVVLAQEILTARVQVPASSTTETTVYTIPMAANYLTAGKKINNRLRGTITQRNNVNSFYTIRVKYAGSTVLTFTTPASTVMAALAFTIDIETVCRSIGASGSLISFGAFNVQGVAETLSQGASTTVDTTAVNTLTITIQANENNAGTGPVNVEMGETICPDHNA
jgi:hypothetical protein